MERVEGGCPARLEDVALGIACPMANEETTAVEFVEAVLAACATRPLRSVSMFVVLDRVSTDKTRPLLEDLATRRPELHVVWAPEDRSVVDAYLRGYREALDAGVDWVLEIDAGFSHHPEDIPRFL